MVRRGKEPKIMPLPLNETTAQREKSALGKELREA